MTEKEFRENVNRLRDITDYKELDWISFVETEFKGFTYLIPADNPKGYSLVDIEFDLLGQNCLIEELSDDLYIIAQSLIYTPVKISQIISRSSDLSYSSLDDFDEDDENYEDEQSIDDSMVLSDEVVTEKGPSVDDSTDQSDIVISEEDLSVDSFCLRETNEDPKKNVILMLCYKVGSKEPVFAKCLDTRYGDYNIDFITYQLLLKLVEAGIGDYFLLFYNSIFEKDKKKDDLQTLNGCPFVNLHIHPYGYPFELQESEFELSAVKFENEYDIYYLAFEFMFTAKMPYDKQMVRILCLNDKYDVIGESSFMNQPNTCVSKNEYDSWYNMPILIKRKLLRRKSQCHIVILINNLPFLEYDVELQPSTQILIGKGNQARCSNACYAAHLYVNNPIFSELGLSVSQALRRFENHLEYSTYFVPSNVSYNDRDLKYY